MDISRVEPGNEETVNVFTETEKGSKSYYKYDQNSGMFTLKKVLKSAFPGSFGFVPRTHHVDGEAMDVLILVSDSIQQGIIVQARPIGLIRMKGEVPDEVLIAVSLAEVASANAVRVKVTVVSLLMVSAAESLLPTASV